MCSGTIIYKGCKPFSTKDIRDISGTLYMSMNNIKRDMTPLIANGKIYMFVFSKLTPHSGDLPSLNS